MSKQKDKYLTLRSQLPKLIDEYIAYLQVDVEEPSPKMVERLSVIQKFLNSYAITIDKEGVSLSLTDLEKLPREFVQNYLANLRLKPAGKRFILYTLAGFWNYLTNTSFTIERGMPLFYRNVFNEWKIVYKESYHNIIYSESKKKTILYTQQELEELLDFMANSYVTTLPTQKKADNWEKEKERNIAIFAIITGTGASTQEVVNLTVRDIDMRKKGIWVVRNNEKQFIRFLPFTVPYIAPFVKERRGRWDLDPSIPSLFLTMLKKPMGRNTLGHLAKNIGHAYGKVITPSILKDSHASIVYKETGDIKKVAEIQGYSLDKNHLIRFIE